MCVDCKNYSPPREGYNDDVRTREHAEILAAHFEAMPIDDNLGWPMVYLGPVLPSGRNIIVRALREISRTLPQE